MARKLFYHCCRFLLWILFKTLFFYQAHHGQKLPEGGFIIAANHLSFLDPIAVCLGLKRRIGFMAREDLFDAGLFSWLIMGLNSFPIKRDGADIQALKEAVNRLKKGEIILVFPEGTRSRTGTLQPGQAGIGLIAAHAHVPVIPVYIYGTNRAMPRGGHAFRLFTKIDVYFGTPITIDKLNVNIRPQRRYQKFADIVMSEIAKTGKGHADKTG
ncbi:MAG: lysophospholipid acyltransferase family protein [Candidatus Omnitrophota bacterium]